MLLPARSQGCVSVIRIAGHLPDELQLFRKADLLLFIRKLDLRDRPVGPERIDVDFDVLVLIDQAVPRLADLAFCHIRVHQKAEVLLLREPAFDLNPFSSGDRALRRLIINVVSVLAALPDPDLFLPG